MIICNDHLQNKFKVQYFQNSHKKERYKDKMQS